MLCCDQSVRLSVCRDTALSDAHSSRTMNLWLCIYGVLWLWLITVEH